jgi:hypothetical protein
MVKVTGGMSLCVTCQGIESYIQQVLGTFLLFTSVPSALYVVSAYHSCSLQLVKDKINTKLRECTLT